MFDTFNWQPPSREVLLKQASLFDSIRQFFKEKGVLEVSTPFLSPATTPDPSIDSVEASSRKHRHAKADRLYLHTSPEFAMKRLLVQGSGDIYQLCQVFRDSDFSPVHNVEFTMLEWYRLGFSSHALMDELYELIVLLAAQNLSRKNYTYKALFMQFCQLDPFNISLLDCQTWCEQNGVSYPDSLDTLDEYLDLILSFHIQPQLPEQQITFVYDYPQSQAALAKLRKQDGQIIASRFEMYWGCIELANGFHELQDAAEQRQRFESENQARHQPVMIDEGFLAALEKGLPDCSGVALGISRLLYKLNAV